jgi:hypothetical protein
MKVSKRLIGVILISVGLTPDITVIGSKVAGKEYSYLNIGLVKSAFAYCNRPMYKTEVSEGLCTGKFNDESSRCLKVIDKKKSNCVLTPLSADKMK